MILSSINFLKATPKPKLDTDKQFTDFIIDKITEEQERREKTPEVLSPIKKDRTGCKPVFTKTTKNEIMVPSRRVSSPPASIFEDTCISIETGDGYHMGFHNMYNKIVLSDVETPNKNCIFKQKRLKSQLPKKDNEQDKILVAFHLNHDKSKYIAVGSDKRVSISINDVEPDPLNPDNRFFVIHEIDNGMIFVQPYHHKGCYFHHIDNNLTVSKFELNLRPPEEFFFKVNKINVLETEMSSASSMDSPVTTMDMTQNCISAKSHHQPQEQILHRQEISLKKVNLHKQQNVQKDSDKHFHKPSLLKGCFGLVSKKDKQHKHKS